MSRLTFCAEERAFRLRALLCALYDTDDTGRATTDDDRENVRGNLTRMALDEAEALAALYKAD